MRPKELFVNTQGTCFLCLRALSSSSNAGVSLSETPEKSEELCLRNICRYLQINPRDVLLKSLQESGQLNNDDDAIFAGEHFPCDFSVTLCGKCGAQAGKLTSLLRELEVTQMMVNYHLQGLDKILNESASLPQDTAGTNEKTTSNLGDITGNPSEEGDVEVKLKQILREQTKTQCSRKLKSIISKVVSPRIHLSRLKKVEEFSDDSKEAEESSSDEVEVISSEAVPDENILESEDHDPIASTDYFEDEDDDVEIVNQQTPTEEEPLAKRSKVLRVSSTFVDKPPIIKLKRKNAAKSASNRIFIQHPGCPYCNQVYLRIEQLEKHLVLCHPEHVFSEEKKLPHLSPEQFKTCCLNLLSREVEACQTVCLIKDHPITHCSYCSASFSQVTDLQVHMCIRHVEKFSDKLYQVQSQLFPISEPEFVFHGVKSERSLIFRSN